jgi:CRP-like cAMP-binding protein
MTVTPDLLRRIPIFDDLQQTDLVEILGCFTEAEFDSGEAVYVEGEAATSACFLIDGTLEVVKALPGSDEIVVATIVPGTMIGEMALLVGGARSATVRACHPSKVVKVSYHFFHAALDQMSGPAFKILRAIIRSMTERLSELQTDILKQWDCETHIASAVAWSETPMTEMPPSFEYRPFLAVMPCFENFNEKEVDTLLSEGGVIEVPRGEYLYREGATPTACYLVLRGAIERSVIRDRRYQLSVLGPGHFSGANALIAQRIHTSDARIRSQALMLRLDQEGFEALFFGNDTACLKFQNMVSANQLMQLKAAGNLRALLVSYARKLVTQISGGVFC